jgi:micrococcal nuclease
MNALNYKHGFRRILLILISLCAVTACAEVYEWKDVKGKRHFSDHPTENSQKLKIKLGSAIYEVDRVSDGDTIRLSNGMKVRLLGVNTPEIRHGRQPGEAGGEDAKAWLKQALLHRKVKLVTDAEPEDKYHRTLAHLFTERNEHINLQLVAAGFAAVDLHPPNLLYANQLVAAQNKAEQAKRGIWGRSEYAPVSAEMLDAANDGGWQRVRGRLAAIRSSRKNVYLVFPGVFHVRIEKRWLSLFPGLQAWIGKDLEVRGWLHKDHSHLTMQILHPSAIKPL